MKKCTERVDKILTYFENGSSCSSNYYRRMKQLWQVVHMSHFKISFFFGSLLEGFEKDFVRNSNDNKI